MIESILFWLAVMVMSVVGELHSPGLFYFLSIACGAGVALGAEFFDQPLSVQLVVFVCGSIITFFLLRQFVVLHMKKQPYKSNTDALIGAKAVVVERIAYPIPGNVKIKGELWSAQSQHNEVIEVESLVEVVAVIGSHVVVKLVK